jgi:hypothetical protein
MSSGILLSRFFRHAGAHAFLSSFLFICLFISGGRLHPSSSGPVPSHISAASDMPPSPARLPSLSILHHRSTSHLGSTYLVLTCFFNFIGKNGSELSPGHAGDRPDEAEQEDDWTYVRLLYLLSTFCSFWGGAVCWTQTGQRIPVQRSFIITGMLRPHACPFCSAIHHYRSTPRCR